MPLDYSVYFSALNAFANTEKLRHQRALITFVPTGDLVAGFTERSLVVTQSDFRVKLQARGGVKTDLIWIALEALFAPAFASPGADLANPFRAKFVPDKIVIARRVYAEPTKWTVTITGSLDGVYTLTGVGFASVSFTAVGQTSTQIRDALLALWNADPKLGPVTTAVINGADAMDISTDTDGFPFIVTATSTGSPITVVNTTVAGAYDDDLDEIRLDNDPQGKLGAFYFIHDLQWDDQTNEQGVQWCIDERTADMRKTYLYVGQSYHKDIPNAGIDTDPASDIQDLVTPLADQNNDRGALFYHDKWEFEVCTELGRCIGYNLGKINFAQRQLLGITPPDMGDNEAVATSKFFNFYSSEAPGGNTKWGFLGSGRFIDDLWAEDILAYEGQNALQQLLIKADAVDYTDASGIASGAGAIEGAILKYSGPNHGYLIPDSLTIIAGKRADQPISDIQDRRFLDYIVTAQRANLINRFGAASSPITFTVTL